MIEDVVVVPVFFFFYLFINDIFVSVECRATYGVLLMCVENVSRLH